MQHETFGPPFPLRALPVAGAPPAPRPAAARGAPAGRVWDGKRKRHGAYGAPASVKSAHGRGGAGPAAYRGSTVTYVSRIISLPPLSRQM